MTRSSSKSAVWSPIFLAVALFGLGQAVQVNLGAFDPLALQWLTFAAAACFVGTLHLPFDRFEQTAEATLVLVCGAAFAYQVTQLVTTMPGKFGPPPPEMLIACLKAVAVAAVLGGAGLARQPWLGRLQPVLLVCAYLYIGAWMIRVVPIPSIDVYLFQHEAVNALLAGENPWTLRYPDIYGGHSPYYGQGVSIDGLLQFGFPYSPLSLLLGTLGQSLAGDVRYSQLACTGLAGLLIAYARPGRAGNAAAAVLLFTPRSFFVLEQSWTEPHVLLGLALTVTCACRWPRALPYALGAFLASKQYLVLALPLVWLLMPRPASKSETAKWMLKTLAVTGLLTIPFALWDLSEFWRSVIVFHVQQPFRPDALSYLAWWASLGRPPPSGAWGFGAALVGVALSLWRLPRTPFGFAVSLGATFLAFFAFNKQAFCNYYYFVMGALAVAIASSPEPKDAVLEPVRRPDRAK